MPAPSQQLHPTAALAERALLPDDPGHALALAQELLDRPLMFNHSRGLWGYTGTAADGEPLTIQSTGLGGPSTAVVVAELCDLGLRACVGVGACVALDDALGLGDLVVARTALTGDGASAALAGAPSVDADPALAAALADGAEHAGAIASGDLLHDPRPAPGALARNLQAATILAAATRRGIPAGCVLAVATAPEAGHLEADALGAAVERAGRAAASALTTIAARPAG